MSEKIRAGEAFKRLAEHDAGAKAFLARLEAAGPRLETLNRVLAILLYRRGESLEARLDALAEEGRRLIEAEREAWRQKFSEPFPASIEDWQRWAARVGLPADWIVAGDWTPGDVLPVVEGYLLRRKDHRPAAPEAADHQAESGGQGTVNARMLELVQRDLARVGGWTAKEWACELGCAASTVVETPTWKDLGLARKRQRIERRADRQRRKRPASRD